MNKRESLRSLETLLIIRLLRRQEDSGRSHYSMQRGGSKVALEDVDIIEGEISSALLPGVSDRCAACSGVPSCRDRSR